ncbi:tyrosine-protein phosphatase non-receptor type 2-like isoform X2 [Periplaneta americana]|uniref:tyrosine-protein phosphatase non-receptor type 2-like isoform X2 n=1 Tax=Periplaneta americana TaxID=6978 RepID=UPI0037E9A30E
MNTVASKSNVESEFLEIDSKGAWPLLYQHIRNECLNYDYTFSEARKSQNKNLNRYRDVSPYDHSRVVLSKGPCDYINANLVTCCSTRVCCDVMQMERAHRQYILTQGPLPHTAGHFWLMVWEQNCKAVLMLNRIIEKNQVKCHQYWPLDSGSDLELPDVGLKVQLVSESEAPYYTTRTLRLTETESGNSRDIIHFHYTTWPDFGVPESPTAFLNFLMVVRESGALDQNVGPPVVHCSAGIGRSGTFCLVDSCLVLIEESGLESVNVREVLLEMRRYRMGLIQTPDQLRFSYWAIIEGSNKYINGSNILRSDASDNTIELSAITPNHSQPTEEQPPQPPPRGASLSRPQVANNHVDSEEQPPDKPLPSEPPPPPTRPLPNTPGSSDEGSYQSPPSSPESRDGVARRRRAERKERVTQQVRDMKRKQQAAESWQQMKRSILQPLTIGIGVGVLLIGGAIAYSYLSSRV